MNMLQQQIKQQKQPIPLLKYKEGPNKWKNGSYIYLRAYLLTKEKTYASWFEDHQELISENALNACKIILTVLEINFIY